MINTSLDPNKIENKYAWNMIQVHLSFSLVFHEERQTDPRFDWVFVNACLLESVITTSSY